MVYYIPIEPLEERYTAQWYRWFPEALENRGVSFEVIDGKALTDKIITGAFLDINSTVHYKAEQLKKISKLFFDGKVQDGDVFFVADIEFWGIESIRYLADLNNIKVRLCGFCHAASHTTEDFISKCASYAKFIERGWFEVFDVVFVGSQYHKNKILEYHAELADKIMVSGNPYKSVEITDGIKGVQKKNRVILTNRPDYEKRPNLTLDVFQILKDKYPAWEFMVTTGRDEWGSGWLRSLAKSLEKKGVITIKEGLTKAEYLNFLAESKIMTGNTIEENFGYCILEAMICNTIPIVSNGYSHPELLEGHHNLLFNSIIEQVELIEQCIDTGIDIDFSKRVSYYDSVLSVIVDCL